MAPDPTTGDTTGDTGDAVDTVIVVARDPATVDTVDRALTDAMPEGAVRRLVAAEAPNGVNVPAMPASDIAAVWMITTEDLAGPDRALGRVLDADARARLDLYPARSTRQFDRGGDQVPERRLAFLHRRPDIDHATFADRWAVHAGLVAHHQPSIASYTQHVIGLTDGQGTAGRGFDACAEFTFAAPVNGVPVARHGSEVGRKVLEADVAGFLGSGGSVSAWVLEG